MLGIDSVTLEAALKYFGDSVGAVLVADQKADRYRALTRHGMFNHFLDEEGTYTDLVQKLWFHFNHSNKEITEEYRVFIPNISKFVGKYSTRLNLVIDGCRHIVHMSIRPLGDDDVYLFFLDEMSEDEYEDDVETQKKVSAIQNAYLFSMTFDLVKDTTGSLSLTEVSNETMNSQISYSKWRQTIVNMILKKDQPLFLERSDPEYLRTHFEPGHIESFDCQMQNLEGVYIWVKLIFGRMDTTDEDDYRFSYMVQNIHESTMKLRAELKHYEELSMLDPLTKIFNHARIETELEGAVKRFRKKQTAVSMLMLDIDHFKRVNDEYGHAVGDSTLVRFAEVVRDELTGANAVCGRWGGEEFAVVVYGTSCGAPEQLAEKLRLRVASEYFPGVGTVTCSIGVTTLLPEDDAKSIFTRADQALYEAKESGRNRVCLR